jgi:hypothetical protein
MMATLCKHNCTSDNDDNDKGREWLPCKCNHMSEDNSNTVQAPLCKQQQQQQQGRAGGGSGHCASATAQVRMTATPCKHDCMSNDNNVDEGEQEGAGHHASAQVSNDNSGQWLQVPMACTSTHMEDRYYLVLNLQYI